MRPEITRTPEAAAFAARELTSMGRLSPTERVTQCVTERSAWDVFVWYGGLLRMGELLNSTGTTKVFAEKVGSLFVGVPWLAVLLAILTIYFYAHYLFASITTHVLAMFPPFVVLLVGIGVPPHLPVFSLLWRRGPLPPAVAAGLTPSAHAA